MSENPDLPRVLQNNLDRNVCTCYDVSKKTIIDAYMNGALSFEELSQKTYCCQGSGCCEAQVKKLVKVLNETYTDET